MYHRHGSVADQPQLFEWILGRKHNGFRCVYYFLVNFYEVCEGYVFTPVCQSFSMGQHYVESQLVWRQHTGNIKCMMGVGHMTPPGKTPPPGQTPPWADTPLPAIPNERAVRILLECILVLISYYKKMVALSCLVYNDKTGSMRIFFLSFS